MKFTDMDKAEAGRLREAVKSLEAMIKAGGGITGNAASSMLLAGALDTAQKRIADFAEREELAVVEERERAEKNLAIAVAVQHEAALSGAENRQYQEFLSREYFTKADFGKLEHFYEHTYDRLSEQGKGEMSHRVWEGVRRDQYQFSELPEVVKEKEAERLHGKLTQAEKRDLSLDRIPEDDKRDFLNAWEQGDNSHAFKVLDRRCFAENVSVSATAKVAKSALASVASPEAVLKAEEARATGGNGQKPAREDKEFDLSDLTLVNTETVQPPPPTVKKAEPAPSR